MQSRSIRFRLTRRLVLSICLVIMMGEGILFFSVRTSVYRRFDEALLTRALALVSLVEYEDLVLTMEFSSDAAVDMEYGGMPKYVGIWKEDHSLFWAYPDPGRSMIPYLPPGTLKKPFYYDIEAGGHSHIRVATFRFKPVRADSKYPETLDPQVLLENAPSLDMVVADDRRPLEIMLRQLVTFLVLGNLLICAGATLIIRRAIAGELQPLERISQRVSLLGIDRLDTRFETAHLPAELSPIALRLNEFLQRLSTAVERERRFSSFAAHELRTPVAELRSVLEVAQRWPEDADPAAVQAECLQISGRMEKLVQTLLDLTRCQSGLRFAEKQPCHIEDIVLGSMEPFRDAADGRGIRFETGFEGNREILTDGDLLSAILSNLLGNAVDYAVPGSTVRIHTAGNRKALVIRVSNRQQGLEAGDMENIFEPFWRKDSARAAQGHIGMGLALSSAYAAVLGAGLTADLAADGWISLTLNLPADNGKVVPDTMLSAG